MEHTKKKNLPTHHIAHHIHDSLQKLRRSRGVWNKTRRNKLTRVLCPCTHRILGRRAFRDKRREDAIFLRYSSPYFNRCCRFSKQSWCPGLHCTTSFRLHCVKENVPLTNNDPCGVVRGAYVARESLREWNAYFDWGALVRLFTFFPSHSLLCYDTFDSFRVLRIKHARHVRLACGQERNSPPFLAASS